MRDDLQGRKNSQRAHVYKQRCPCSDILKVHIVTLLRTEGGETVTAKCHAIKVTLKNKNLIALGFVREQNAKHLMQFL